ncbi:hypothetical protein MCHI_004046 [Candidatus Magnetoovum chiemensis]|nr:hypothetical protein MCHI_004046 [Candidatus Magnetoovum chiemensis]
MAEINELDMPEKVRKNNGTVIIAGGGKFTAKFNTDTDAETAKQQIIKLVSTKLPMLEYQVSEIVPSGSLKDAKELEQLNNAPYPGLINELNEQKRCFRGYGLTYNPHFKVCDECGEYPATDEIRHKDDKGKDVSTRVCCICKSAKDAASIKLKDIGNDNSKQITSIATIYKKFYEEYKKKIKHIPDNKIKETDDIEIPMDFEDLFPEPDSTKRLAIWSSDINGMGDKIAIWFNQKDYEIKDTFDKIKQINIDIVSSALIKTFTDYIKGKSDEDRKDKDRKKETYFIPFRLIVAGGDDLCIVMRDSDIIKFTQNLSSILNDEYSKLDNKHPLSLSWLKNKATDDKKDKLKPYSFGGSFIVASFHTPFKKMHHVAEELMSNAKKETNRMGNSVNWLVMSADEEPQSEKLIEFEKPLFIDDLQRHNNPNEKTKADDRLTFNEYIELANRDKNISGSHTQQIISKIIEYTNHEDPNIKKDAAGKLETWLIRTPDAAKKDSAISRLLREDKLRDGNSDKPLNLKRIATLFELMRITNSTKDSTSDDK